MLLSLITNDLEMAGAADAGGIDRIFIDLEKTGKPERQSGHALFVSDHRAVDVRRMKAILRRAEIMVRVDSPHLDKRAQIDQVIDYGADVVLLPYFHGIDEASEFVAAVAGRAVAALLVETPESAAILPSLCALPGIGEIHIGLNDLSIGLGRPFLFDPVVDGTVDRMCQTLRGFGMAFGFGGIASLSRSDLPLKAEWVLAEQVAQGATRGWLSRTFRDIPPSKVSEELGRVRTAIDYWSSAPSQELATIRGGLRRQIVAESERVKADAHG